MAFQVETGAGLSDANAYAAVADADAYALDRGITSWASATTAQKQVALIDATLFLDATYRFVGTRTSATQALAWPRTGAADQHDGNEIASNAIPIVLKRAVCELAVKALAASLLQDQERGGMIDSVKVGPVAVSYAAGAPAGVTYAITGLLKGLLVDASSLQVVQIGLTADPPTDAVFTQDQFVNNGP